MTSSFHDQVQELFFDALDKPEQDRLAFIKRRAQGDFDLRREVCQMLDASQPGDDRLNRAASNVNLSEILKEPETIGGYAVVRTLGEGGMGVVYEARQTNPQRPVAIKLMRIGGGEEALRRFRYEAEVLGVLQHEAIAHVYESGVTGTSLGQQPYFSMEYVPGMPIDEYVAETGLDHEAIALLMIRVLDGIHHAHQKGVVHRDIKPANILVRDDGQPKILDFGIARIADLDGDRSMVTATGQVMGTLAYMSPEQITARPEEIDTRADIYAMGVLMFELISGTRPIDVGDVALPVALQRVLEDPPKDLAAVAPGTPGDLVTIVHKTLAKDKDRRYSSAEALAEDLRRFIAREPILARPPSRPYLIKRFVQRHRTAAILASLALIGLVGGAIVSTSMYLREQRTNSDLLTAQFELTKSNTWLQEATELAEARRKEAESRLAQLASSTDLLQHVLGEQLPFEDGAELAFGTVVSRASIQVIEGLKQQPEQRAWLATSLAGTALQIGVVDRASLLIEAAEESLNEVESPAQILGFKVRFLAARLLLTRQEYAASEAAFAALLPELDEAEGPGIDVLRVELHGQIGQSQLAAGNLDGAERSFETMLAEAAALDADPGLLRVEAMMGLANLHITRREFEDTVDMMTTVLFQLDSTGEGDTSTRAEALQLLGGTYITLGDIEQGRPALEQALSITRSYYGEGHPMTAIYADTLATAERRDGNDNEALALYTEAVDALEPLGDVMRDEFAGILSNRGALRLDLGEVDGALEDFVRCEELMVGVEGLDAAMVLAFCKSYKGKIEATRGNFEEAKEFLRAALAAKAGVFGTDAHPTMNFDLQELAAVHRALGEHAEHVSASLEVARLRGQFLGLDEPGRLEALVNAGEALKRYEQDASFQADVAAELQSELKQERERQ